MATEGNVDPEVSARPQAVFEEQHAGLFAWLQHAAEQLKRSVLALFYASQDPSVGWAPRVIAAFVLAYALSPLDLIPDFIPVLGILDDLILLPGMIWLAIKLTPDGVWQRALQRAVEEPLHLSKCWPAACCVFLLWNISAVCVTYMICKKFGNMWWSTHWWIAAALSGLVLFISETAWLVNTVYTEEGVKVQADRQSSDEAGVNTSLLGSSRLHSSV